jgi:hypothetical protein
MSVTAEVDRDNPDDRMFITDGAPREVGVVLKVHPSGASDLVVMHARPTVFPVAEFALHHGDIRKRRGTIGIECQVIPALLRRLESTPID